MTLNARPHLMSVREYREVLRSDVSTRATERAISASYFNMGAALEATMYNKLNEARHRRL